MLVFVIKITLTCSRCGLEHKKNNIDKLFRRRLQQKPQASNRKFNQQINFYLYVEDQIMKAIKNENYSADANCRKENSIKDTI